MTSARETVLLAEALFERLGLAAVGMADVRSDELRETGDMKGAQLWRDVSRAMILIATRPNAVRHAASLDGVDDNITWTLMQRIEGYRHLASQAEAVTREISTAAPEMERIAAGWRELAATMEELAAGLDLGPVPQGFRGTYYELN